MGYLSLDGMKPEPAMRDKYRSQALGIPDEAAAVRRKRRRPRIQPEQPNKGALLRWNIVFGVAAMSVILVFVVMYFGKHRSGSRSSHTQGRYDMPAELPAASTVPEPLGEMETLRIVREALANRDPERVAGYFAPSSFADPMDVIRTLDGIKARDGRVMGMSWLGGNFSNNRHIEELVVNFGEKEATANRLAQLYPQADGKWRIDFASFARTASPPWPEILSGERLSARVRVFVYRENYYNRDFADDSRWQCYALVSPDVDEILYGYVLRSSRQEKALERILALEQEFHRATLDVEVHTASSPHQFEISSVLSENWFIGDSPVDEEP